jgi:4-pyridoxate dehydrogenase
MTPAFLAAMDSLGYQRNSDFNGADSEGYGPRQGTILQGRRVSTATAYLKPASHRDNLVILTDTRAARIRIEERRATGVDVLTAGGERSLTARREVIVSGGAVLSPQLLMLSGIGDETALAPPAWR